ncbi:MAG TPA: hypothetical protein VHZ24_00505 [Pirellulales bacterium]|jgi:hypothetical protein|nr:hypothetical protein [Pirellulales bacterium]
MDDPRAWYHVILTTYGAWLYGDPRGFRTRHHRERVEGDDKHPPPPGIYARRARRSRELLKQPPVVIPFALRALVGQSLRHERTRLGAWVLVIAVGGQHVHLLVKMPAGRPRDWIGRAKKHATDRLRAEAWQGRLWGVRRKALRIRDREHQRNVFHYILAHAADGAWTGVWKNEPKREGE